jgi:hypothetical protein
MLAAFAYLRGSGEGEGGNIGMESIYFSARRFGVPMIPLSPLGSSAFDLYFVPSGDYLMRKQVYRGATDTGYDLEI